MTTTTQTVRIRDLTSGDTHDLPAETPALHDPTETRDGLDLPPSLRDSQVRRLDSYEPGQIVYARSEDPADDGTPGRVLWWRSEVLAPATADPLAAVSAAYTHASGSWSGADWTHETDESDPASPTYCEGGQPDCATCQAAERDAGEAERLACEALDAAGRGDWGEAVERARAAARVEAAYGDDPVWAPYVAAVEAAAESAAESTATEEE